MGILTTIRIYDDVCQSDATMCHITNDDWKEIGEFLDCVREDYNKLDNDTFTTHISKHVIGIKRAISHQNIVVQPNNMVLECIIPIP